MKRLKLFEDFEEKPFYKIEDIGKWMTAYIDSIPFSEYSISNLDNKLKSRLAIVFGHSDFYYSKEAEGDNECIYIYERLHSLVQYKIFLTEDEWFYIESKNRAVGSTSGIIHYYKCDNIKGMISAIKYDYEEINERVSLYYKLPARQVIYGGNTIRQQFFGAQPILLDTQKFFPIFNFPEEEVNKIIPKDLDLKVEDKTAELTWKNKTIDLYYIKETNRFNCADLLNNDYWTCLGIDGLKSLLTIIIIDEITKTTFKYK